MISRSHRDRYVPVVAAIATICFGISWTACADDQTCKGPACGVTYAGAGHIVDIDMLRRNAHNIEMQEWGEAWNADFDASVSSTANPDSEPCPLPIGARWCQAKSGSNSWVMALYPDMFDELISRKICTDGFWEFENPTAMGVNESTSKGSVLLDIGANVGWYTFMFASHGHKVIAVEPMAANRDLMQATLCRNPELAPRIHIFAAALTESASPGQTCSIFSAYTNAGNGVLACSAVESQRLTGNGEVNYVQREKVRLTTLNTLIQEWPLVFGEYIDVVKMDVEGHECKVLAGSTRLFGRFHPKYLMFETRLDDTAFTSHGSRGNTFDCIAETVRNYGPYGMHLDSFAGQPMSDTDFFADFSGRMVDIFFSL